MGEWSVRESETTRIRISEITTNITQNVESRDEVVREEAREYRYQLLKKNLLSKGIFFLGIFKNECRVRKRRNYSVVIVRQFYILPLIMSKLVRECVVR